MIISLAYLILFFSLLVALLNNPANSLFCLAACYFSSAILLLVLNIEFLALILVIVYIGALLMLFLFILMLSNLKEFYKQYSDLLINIFTFYFSFSLIFFITKFINFVTLNSFQAVYNFEHLYIYLYLFPSDLDCFIYLYTDFFVWFFLVTLILFISVIGSLFLLVNKQIY